MIYNTDCLGPWGMSLVPTKSVDLILTDLPYGTTKCKWDVILPFDKLWAEYNRIIKPNGAILLFGTEPFSSKLRLSNLAEYRYDWVWNKKRAANFLFMNKQPGKMTENISVFYAKQPTYNPQKTLNPKGSSTRHLHKNPAKIHKNLKEIMGDSWSPTELDASQNYAGKDYEPDKLLPNNILEYAKPTKRTHPTEKPVDLLEYLIKTYTNPGEIVLDSCCGTGSTLIAAKNLGRRYIGFETDPQYYSIAQGKLDGNYEPKALLKE